MSSRDDVLGRLRVALHDVPPTEATADVAVRRDYRRSTPADADLFAERVEDYRAVVRRVADGDVPAAVAACVQSRGGPFVAPAGLPDEWLSALDGAVARDDGGLSHDELDTTSGVVTGCAVAITETGTIVLDGGPAQGRRAITLVPDYHLCVVLADQVVGSVPEALGRLDPTRPLTFISGPSATSDIELERVEGVHGPRTLEVILVARPE